MSSILITGGTGSFGKAFVKHLLDTTEIDRIIIYSRDEHKQEKMAAELNSDRLRFFIGDVRDKNRLKLALYDCTYVVHAAALKIVPAGEYNPQEFIRTNIMGSLNLVEAILDQNDYYTPSKIIALSTDKAVNPVNLYGATKLCMEKLFLSANNLAGNRHTTFSVCRYGNVANSNGSVIPKFKNVKEQGGLYPITDMKMTRFWIELEDAAKFVWDRLQSMEGGEIFIPNMPSFNILDLVRAFENGYTPISVIGIRQGEKLHEQIDDNRFSNTNERFLSWQEIRERLLALGVVS